MSNIANESSPFWLALADYFQREFPHVFRIIRPDISLTSRVFPNYPGVGSGVLVRFYSSDVGFAELYLGPTSIVIEYAAYGGKSDIVTNFQELADPELVDRVNEGLARACSLCWGEPAEVKPVG